MIAPKPPNLVTLRLQGLVLLFAVVVLPLGVVHAQDTKAKADAYFKQVWAKLQAKVAVAKMSVIVCAQEVLGQENGPESTSPSKAGVSVQADPVIIYDLELGVYNDLSYGNLSDDGLSWEERTRLFGGETVHYGELTAQERQAKEKELQSLLAKIDMKLVRRCEADIRSWLDQQAENPPSDYQWNRQWPVVQYVPVLFRAYEIFGDEKYFKAGLSAIEPILAAQSPRGNWGGNMCRIQDHFQDMPFWVLMYAYKLTGDMKYFEAARRCADCLLALQSESGGWPDWWDFGNPDKTRDPVSTTAGVRLGTSHNDSATTAPTAMMVSMYHMTKDKKYIARLGNLGPFIFATQLGEGKVRGWAEQYDHNGKPARARGYEIELPYPRTLTRSVGPLLIWLYLMTGEERYMRLLREAYEWHESVRKKELDPEQLEAWKLMGESWAKAGRPMHYCPGWPDAWLPDGSNWGRVTAYKMIPWSPVTAEMKKKYGGIIHSLETDHGAWPGNVGYLLKWGNDIRAGGAHPECSMGFSHSSRNNALVQVRRALLEYKKGGYKGLLKYYTNPTKYTPGQYLQARVDAAKRAVDQRNVRLASNHEKGIRVIKAPGGLIAQKSRWYGPQLTKWSQAYNTTGQWGNVAWYQWQLVYDTMLAQGKISADAAARGGRGLETVAMQNHLDSWDVLGEWGMQIYEVENYFDVPVEKK